VGVQLETDDIEPRLSEIRGGGRYESLGYDVAQSDDQTRLRIGVTEKTYGPPILIPIIQFQSSDISDVELSLGARLTGYDVGGYGSELRLDGLVGSNDLLAIEYFRPIGRRGLFISPRAYSAASSANLFSEGVRVAEYRQRKVAAGLDAGYIFNRRSQLRIGYEVADAQAKVSIGDPLLPDIKGLVSDASTRFVYDGLNSAMVPTSGVRVSAEGHWFFQAPGAARAFPLAELRAAAFQPLTNKSSIFVYGGGGTAFSRIAGPLEQFTLGGPFRLGAYGRGEFRGSNYVLASGGFMHRLGYLPELLGGKIYAVGWYEVGCAFNRSAETNYLNSVSGAAMMETRLGPFRFGGAFGEGGRGRIFVSWGRSF
jgi:NTE family protein